LRMVACDAGHSHAHGDRETGAAVVLVHCDGYHHHCWDPSLLNPTIEIVFEVHGLGLVLFFFSAKGVASTCVQWAVGCGQDVGSETHRQ